MSNKKLKFKVSVSLRSGAVAALEGPKEDVTVYTVESVARGSRCGDLVCAVSSVKTRQQRSHC